MSTKYLILNSWTLSVLLAQRPNTIQNIFTIYAQYIYIIFTLYSQYIHIIFTLYSQYIHNIFTIYSQYIHNIIYNIFTIWYAHKPNSCNLPCEKSTWYLVKLSTHTQHYPIFLIIHHCHYHHQHHHRCHHHNHDHNPQNPHRHHKVWV